MSSSSRCWRPSCQFATPYTKTYRNRSFARSSPPMWRNQTTPRSTDVFSKRSRTEWARPMLRIDRIELEDFGPFKGRQAINLPEASGVAVVYGENMRGKTVLLNAIRFALFGKVLGRARRKGSLHTIGNWEQAAAGRYGFEVVLQFQDDGRQYSLTRSCRPRAGVVPEQDSDYDVKHFLQRDGDVLGPGQATSEIERIMPEQIARFFLFDERAPAGVRGSLAQRERHGTTDQRGDRTDPRRSSAHAVRVQRFPNCSTTMARRRQGALRPAQSQANSEPR